MRDPDTQGKGSSPATDERSGEGTYRDEQGRAADRRGAWSPAQPQQDTGVGDQHVVDIDATDDPSKD